MTPTYRQLTLTVVVWMALAFLVVVTGLCTIGVVNSYDTFARVMASVADADYERVKTQLTVLAVIFGLCCQGALVQIGVLVGYILFDRLFRPSALVVVDALVVTLAVATAAVLIVTLVAPGPLPIVAGLFASTILGVTVALVLLVLRSLLRRRRLPSPRSCVPFPCRRAPERHEQPDG